MQKNEKEAQRMSKQENVGGDKTRVRKKESGAVDERRGTEG